MECEGEMETTLGPAFNLKGCEVSHMRILDVSGNLIAELRIPNGPRVLRARETLKIEFCVGRYSTETWTEE